MKIISDIHRFSAHCSKRLEKTGNMGRDLGDEIQYREMHDINNHIKT